MGDSTCLVQTFSHPSDTFHEPQEGNPIHDLGESISFGRFMTESLAWEKWSSFNHNRYLEEVEKYSKPGSVAQKKAYFEAHYKKKIAEQKAAAALEDEDSADNNAPQAECDNGFCDVGILDTELVGSDCLVKIEVPNRIEREDEISTVETGFSLNAKRCDSNLETSGFESITGVVVPVTENNVLEDSSMLAESPNQHEDVENKMTNDVKFDTTVPSEKLPLKENSSANQESSASTMKVEPSASSLKASVHNKTSKLPFPPARPRSPMNSRKENNPNLSSKKTEKDLVDKKRPTPTALHLSLNFAPSRVGETKKIATPVLQKTIDSRGSFSSTKTPKNCSSPQRTADRQASGDRVKKPLPVTPPDSRRMKAQVDTVHESRKMDVKWKSLSVDHSKTSSAFGSKACSPSVSSSFSLRSEERAAKRKEYFQRLQEEHNAKEAQKMQLHEKSKEKAETELKKLRQNLGFKATPMPDFYRETQLQKTPLKKIPLTRPRSPKLGRKSSSSSFHETSPLPLKMPSSKNGDSKQAVNKISQIPTRSVTSIPKKSAHENASPNIQR